MAGEPDLERTVVPVIEESVMVTKRKRTTDRVRIRTRTVEDMVETDETLETVEAQVERVPVGRWLDEPLRQRQEGDTTIIPVMEEVAVTVKKLRLVEEVRITRRTTTRQHRERTPVRRTEVSVERQRAPRQHPNHPDQESVHMTTIIVGLFKQAEAADRARKPLAEFGATPDSVQIFNGGHQDVAQRLADFGIDEEDGSAFATALGQGAGLLVLEIDTDRVDDALAALNREGADAVDTYEDADGDAPDTATAPTESRTLKEIEERVEIGKREVASGGVTARTRVTERPVEKTLDLKTEKVDVHRRDAQAVVSAEAANAAFQESAVVVTETAEEAEVRKAARLIGEVEIAKTTGTRQETVKETARASKVDIEKTPAGPTKSF